MPQTLEDSASTHPVRRTMIGRRMDSAHEMGRRSRRAGRCAASGNGLSPLYFPPMNMGGRRRPMNPSLAHFMGEESLRGAVPAAAPLATIVRPFHGRDGRKPPPPSRTRAPPPPGAGEEANEDTGWKARATKRAKTRAGKPVPRRHGLATSRRPSGTEGRPPPPSPPE